MRLGEIGEFGLIARLKERVERPDGRVLAGIGDDAAVIGTAPDELLLLTTDVDPAQQGNHDGHGWLPHLAGVWQPL